VAVEEGFPGQDAGERERWREEMFTPATGGAWWGSQPPSSGIIGRPELSRVAVARLEVEDSATS